RNDEDSIVISYGAWQRRFGGARGVIGRAILIDDTRKTIAAVMPSSFAFPREEIEVWYPLVFTPLSFALDQRGNEYLEMVARLAPGASARSAQIENDVITTRVIDLDPNRRH